MLLLTLFELMLSYHFVDFQASIFEALKIVFYNAYL